MSWIIKNRILVGTIVLMVLIGFYYDQRGYNRADKAWHLKTTIEANKALQAEIDKRKEIENNLAKEKEKYNVLDQKYRKASKADPAYKCIIPDSLREYINNI